MGGNNRRRKGPPVSVQLEQEKSSGNGRPEKAKIVRVQRMIVMMEMMVKNGRSRGNLT